MQATAIQKAALALTLLLAAPAFAHGGHDHAKKVCKKAGKVIRVKGKNDEAKKESCEAKGGTWEDAETDE